MFFGVFSQSITGGVKTKCFICFIPNKVKLATIVEGHPKAPFSIATTPKCREECYSFPWICSTLSLICTLYCWVLIKEVSSTIFKVFDMTQPGIEPRFPRPLVNTLTLMPMYGFIYYASGHFLIFFTLLWPLGNS